MSCTSFISDRRHSMLCVLDGPRADLQRQGSQAIDGICFPWRCKQSNPTNLKHRLPHGDLYVSISTWRPIRATNLKHRLPHGDMCKTSKLQRATERVTGSESDVDRGRELVDSGLECKGKKTLTYKMLHDAPSTLTCKMLQDAA